jgi:hypothetical protein
MMFGSFFRHSVSFPIKLEFQRLTKVHDISETLLGAFSSIVELLLAQLRDGAHRGSGNHGVFVGAVGAP